MLTLDETKLHLRVDASDEDTLITALMETARLAVANYLNMPEASITRTVPSPNKSAALLMVADLYETGKANQIGCLTATPLISAYLILTVQWSYEGPGRLTSGLAWSPGAPSRTNMASRLIYGYPWRP